MTDPTAPPVLSPLLTMTQRHYDDGTYAKIDLRTELDAHRAEVARLTQLFNAEHADHVETMAKLLAAEQEMATLKAENEQLSRDVLLFARKHEQETARLKVALHGILEECESQHDALESLMTISNIAEAALIAPDVEKV
jgi:hypothetical protein